MISKEYAKSAFIGSSQSIKQKLKRIKRTKSFISLCKTEDYSFELLKKNISCIWDANKTQKSTHEM